MPGLKPDLTPEALTLLHEPPPKDIDEFLSQPYVIERTKIDEYEEKGFVKLEKVISGRALEYYRELIGFAVGHVFKDDSRPLSDKPVYERSFLQAFNLWLEYPAIKHFVFSTRFAQLARDLMRVDGVRLWFDQALYKQPGGRITDYHQDAGHQVNEYEKETRKLSMTVQLSEPDTYEGGEFYFYDGNKDEIEPDIQEQGSILVFDSRMWHRVAPVTKGVRYSLVSWILGPRFQ